MTGQLMTTTNLDYEKPADGDRDNTYEFMVQASDGMTVAFRSVSVSVSNAIDNLSPAGDQRARDRRRRGEQHGGRPLLGHRP